jgi:nitric oxide reductase subunit B
MPNPLISRGERITLVMIACALACLVLSVLVGALGALYYLPELAGVMRGMGISLVQVRPLHTTFASAWIYMGAVACISYFLFCTEGPTATEMRRFKLQMILWGLAGLGVLVTLPFGITSGREYLGFHPAISLLILGGWILFAITFFSRVAHGFWSRPVYVYMWAAGILFFVYTFIEGHAYLLPGMERYPIADLQVQWKSCGSLVASFNQMVYGSLIFVGERISGDKRVGHSRLSFALFGVGLLNSFTNFAHHTYHLPQSHTVKWIAFGVSMLEIIILVLVFQEVTSLIAKKSRSSLEFVASVRFIGLSKCWNLCLLSVAILISIPPLNALIHGTHLVMAHAMGSELAIDSYILFAVFATLLAAIFPKREVVEKYIDSQEARRTITLLNISLVALVLWLAARGLAVGVTRYLDIPEPAWLDQFPYIFAILGFAVGTFLVRLALQWLPLLTQAKQHKTWA